MTSSRPQGRGVLVRSSEDRVICGVAGGIGEYFEVDSNLVRLGFVALSVLFGVGIPLYLAAFLLLPDEEGESSISWLVEHKGEVFAPVMARRPKGQTGA